MRGPGEGVSTEPVFASNEGEAENDAHIPPHDADEDGVRETESPRLAAEKAASPDRHGEAFREEQAGERTDAHQVLNDRALFGTAESDRRRRCGEVSELEQDEEDKRLLHTFERLQYTASGQKTNAHFRFQGDLTDEHPRVDPG